MSYLSRYKTWTPEDKAALKDLMAETIEKSGRSISLKDMIQAVDPDESTPESVAGL